MKNKFRLVGAAFAAVLAAECLIAVSGLVDDEGPADLIVVFGNKVEKNGEPSPRLTARLDRAIELYEEGAAPMVVVSGAVGKEGFDEAKVMKSYLVAHGVPERAVVPDFKGRDTLATARFTRNLMHARRMISVIVVTQYFHVPRSRLAFRQCGIDEVKGAHARYFELRDVYSIARETVAYPYYYLFKGKACDQG